MKHNLNSHPGSLLKDHLLNTANFSKNTVLSKEIPNKNLYSEISFLIAISHDFAKSTSFFQNYLQDNSLKTELKNHGSLSAVLGFYVIDNYINSENLNDFWFLAPIAWIVIFRHHGNIRNILRTGGEQKKLTDENEIKRLKKQILDIKEYNCDEISEFYNNYNINIMDFFNEFDNIIFKIKKSTKKLSRSHNMNNYFLILFFYSILLDADKMDASKTELPERMEISEDIVDIYKSKFANQDSKINLARNESYNDVMNSLNSINIKNDKIFSINLPTGCGKTFAGFSFSLKLRDKINSQMGISPKIIYSLPFLSIIDQNANVFSEILINANKYPKELVPNNVFIKHHNMSDLYYRQMANDNDDITELDIDKSKLLVEGWNSEIIATTFIQFFYSLVTNKNKSARKFHNIVNSIIVLDEIQSVPYKYWNAINNILKFLAENYNCWIILMTATEPLIFKNNEIKDLVKNKEKYFNYFNRIDYEFNKDEILFDDFKNIAWDEIISNPKKDIMFVLNTINSAQELYKYIKCNFEEEFEDEIIIDSTGVANINNNQIINISTSIVPVHRLKRIKSIKKSKSNVENPRRNIIITTQVIEAGVDISVDIIFRDMAPLDSIVQTAGRCNRNDSLNKGITKVVILKDENRKLSSYVYDLTLIEATKTIIKDISNIEEKDFNNVYVPTYFANVSELGTQDNSILNDIENLDFSEFKNDFKLIDNDYDKIDVFVEIDDCSKKLWNKYQKIRQIENIFYRKNEFLKIKSNFYNYIISINSKKLGKVAIDDNGGLVYLKMDNLDDKYDIETGFISSDKEEVFIW
ncbi:MAG: CRISPR-associated helicase Cas3' [Methanobacteriaceae archaeon]